MKDVRPTSGRVLSALFSILGERVSGARFLDMFAGTGRVGLEALSRGADSCVFIESVRARADELRKKAGDSLVLSLEVRRAVSWLVKREMTFSLVFADPPYCSGWCEALPAVPGIAALLAEDAVFVVEHSVREKMDKAPGFEIFSAREYGETCLTFLRRLI
ncbi:MAG: RsmD family RNA methyltransferase [Synergistaceae bacterium]|nr:RsmD family RNA methyltransferase [Synergistaceae bacterium]